MLELSYVRAFLCELTGIFLENFFIGKETDLEVLEPLKKWSDFFLENKVF